MKKERALGFILVLFVIVFSVSFIFAESVVANSMSSFGTGPVIHEARESFWNFNTVLVIVAAVLLIIGAILWARGKKKAKKSKKKKQ